MAEAIKVCCRFRPQNKIELAQKAYEIIQYADGGTVCLIKHPDTNRFPKAIRFDFDRVFNTKTPQQEVFEYAAKHLVGQLFSGFNATVFAFGQTGAGKTYSMEGKIGSPHRGIVPRTVEHIFDAISEADETLEFTLKVSFIEIYLENLRDLLNPGNAKMRIREGPTGVYIEGVCDMYVRNASEVMDMMTMGSGNRTVSSTGMNAVSSRSHGVFILRLECTHTETGSKKMSKLMMVDLAGSEKIAKTGATGQLLEEAKKINQSLSALGNVMNSLSEGKSHVAYRDSVLTRLLSDSLGGNCKTTLLIACSCSSYNVDETISTLRFGSRAKKIKNKAKVNAEKTVAEYKKEVEALTKKMEMLKFKNKKLLIVVKALKLDLAAALEGNYDKQATMYDKVLGGGRLPKTAGPVDDINLDDIETTKAKRKKKKKKIADTFNGETPAATEAKTEAEPEEEVGGDAPDLDVDEDKEDDGEEVRSGGSPDDVPAYDGPPSAEMTEKLKNAEERADMAEAEVLELKKLLVQQQAEMDMVRKRPPLSTRHSGNKRRSSQSSNPASIREDGAVDEDQESVGLASDDDDDTAFGFGDGGGDVQIVTETVMQLPTDVSDLTPELLEKARRGLQTENRDLRKQTQQLTEETNSLQEQMRIKQEKLELAKQKTEEIEMQCDKLMLQHDSLEERIDGLHKEKRRIEKEKEETDRRVDQVKRDLTREKERVQQLHNENERRVHQVRQQEQQRAEEFIKTAQQQIASFKRNQNRGHGQPGRGTAMGRMRDQYVKDMKAQNRKEALYETQMKELEQRALEEIQMIRLEQMKLKQSLQSKIEDYLRLKMKLSEKEDELRRVNAELQWKDKKMRQQNAELMAFGKLKLESDKIHTEQYNKAQETIHKLKMQIKKLQEKNTEAGAVTGNWQQFGYPSPQENVNSALLLKEKKNVVIPLRGGGKKGGGNGPVSLRGGGGAPVSLRGGGAVQGLGVPNVQQRMVMGPTGNMRPVSMTADFFNANYRGQMTPVEASQFTTPMGGGIVGVPQSNFPETGAMLGNLGLPPISDQQASGSEHTRMKSRHGRRDSSGYGM